MVRTTGWHRRRGSVLLAGAAALACFAALLGSAPALGAGAGGGLAPSGTPRLSDATCLSRCVGAYKATPGAVVRLKGSFLDETKRVVFKGTGKPAVVATYKSRTANSVEVIVPPEAASGRPRVVSEDGLRSNPLPKVLEVVPAASLPRQVFPVRGAYEFWAGWGDGRGHQGADVGGRCGTPLVAVAAGKLTKSAYHGRAGHYLIIDLKRTDQDLAYMHLSEPTTLPVGSNVSAGQVVGYMGDSGNASGCHLHFELWEGEYYGGGAPVDPMPFLKSLEPRAKRAKSS